MGFFSRIFGITKTKLPGDPSCWRFADGEVTVDLGRASELSAVGEALRLEGESLPERILLVRTDDGYWACANKCTHGGRRLDPVPTTQTVQCCSVGKTTFDGDGKRLSGSGKEDIATFPVRVEDEKVIISVA